MLTSPDGSCTEVKVPYTPNITEDHVDTNTLSHMAADSHWGAMNTVGNCGGEQDGVTAQNGDDGQNGEYYVQNDIYKRLVSSYRGLPREMFVNQVLRDEASCESKLEEMRSSLFEYLKEAEDFPYGLQCMLKRRKGTRMVIS